MTLEDCPDLRLERQGAVAVLSIHRPEKLNALNAAVIAQLHRAFLKLKHDAAARAIVLTGAGEKAFVAGADIKELAAQSPAEMLRTSAEGQQAFLEIERLGKPVIAAINGYALGGGLELAMSCTFRTAAENAKVGLPEVTLGILPGYAGTQRLVRLVGKGKALEMMLSGDAISASEAHRLGLVNHVFPAAELLPKTLEIAQKLATRAPLAIAAILEAGNAALDRSLQDGGRLESELFCRLAATSDTQEGLRAFLEKRPAQFKGE
jgi:enoyl-CoA hydratase